MRSLRTWGLLTTACAVIGCGPPRSDQTRVDVSAATSFKPAMAAIAKNWGLATVNSEFAGSDAIAAAIRSGRRPDLLVSANSRIPAALNASGLVGSPVEIAANRLVIAVPRRSSRVSSLVDLGSPGVKVALGSSSVPIGAYADELLSRLPAGERRAILANVRTREPDSGGVVGKLREGAVDAALLYSTDVTASRGSFEAIALPAGISPKVVYSAAVVTGAKHARRAMDLIAYVRSPAGQRLLESIGYLPPTG